MLSLGGFLLGKQFSKDKELDLLKGFLTEMFENGAGYLGRYRAFCLCKDLDRVQTLHGKNSLDSLEINKFL